MRAFLSFIRCGWFLALSLAGCLATAASPSTWWHELKLHDLQGRDVPPPVQPSVIVFLDPECPVSNGYLPVLNALHAEFSGRGISFLGAYVDPTATLEQLRTHAREFAISFVTVDDRERRVARFAGATYSSEVVVLHSDGTRLYRGRIDDRVGPKGAARPAPTRHDLREVLQRLSAGERGPFQGLPGFGCTIEPPVKR